MTYTFPESLRPLRDYLRRRGCDVTAFATARQAAYMAQQLIGSRIKFPPVGQDMRSTLIAIQEAVTKSPAPGPNTPEISGSAAVTKAKSGQGKKVRKSHHTPDRPTYLAGYDAAAVSTGIHIFADGCCEPNPGPGGWGFVAYSDGEEFHSESGSEADTTNNRMEISAALMAIAWAANTIGVPVSIWCDSKYVVNGCNEWRHGWRAKGWRRGGENAGPKSRHLANADLWQRIDSALCDPMAANISIAWVKGHAGHFGNERADELAEIGRQKNVEAGSTLASEPDLDAEYRAVMAG